MRWEYWTYSWMNWGSGCGCGYDEEDEVKNKSGIEEKMYRNGTWMVDGWVYKQAGVCVQKQNY
jgi:hypothetical protein